ncbi:MAG: enoyl-CoA hydratase/isomerase family protein [Coriobacteriales bacterium]|jgi:enoyl-CoA hydratase|nr:enoyl-CoA hydratase/isomerase family protein [Coriobacteriales bacterium]
MKLPQLNRLELEIIDKTIAVLTFNIPEKLNALGADAHEDLHSFVDLLQREPAVRVGVIRSAVKKAFMAGTDITGFSEAPFPPNRLREAIDRIENCPKPVIAAIGGYCLGGGVELAMGCDIRILADTATLALPEVGLGIMPGAGGIQRLARVAGMGVAKELALTARRISAEEAYAKGLAAMVVPFDALWDETLKLARRVAAQAPAALALVKQSANLALDTDRATAAAFERWGAAFISTTADAAEGKRAFIEKRPPVFTGA